MRFEVGTEALRQALTAVLPIASSSSVDSFKRVRFELAEHTLFVASTDGRAALVAEIGADVWTDHLGGGHVFELPTADAKKILDVHQMPTGKGIVRADVRLLVTISDDSWRSEDASGLLASAEALEMPLAAQNPNTIDVVGLVGERVAAFMTDAGGAEAITLEHAPISISLAMFDKAVKAYQDPIVLRLLPNRRSALVTIGSDVIGVASTSDITSEVYRNHEGGNAYLTAWNRWSAVLPDEMRADLDVAGPQANAAQPDTEPDNEGNFAGKVVAAVDDAVERFNGAHPDFTIVRSGDAP